MALAPLTERLNDDMENSAKSSAHYGVGRIGCTGLQHHCDVLVFLIVLVNEWPTHLYMYLPYPNREGSKFCKS